MQQATTSAAAPTAAALPTYRGSLGDFLEHQRQVKEEQGQALMRAANLRSMRASVLSLVDGSPMFSLAERAATAQSVEACHSLEQLQRWFMNVFRVRKDREDVMQLAYAEGACTFIAATPTNQ